MILELFGPAVGELTGLKAIPIMKEGDKTVVRIVTGPGHSLGNKLVKVN